MGRPGATERDWLIEDGDEVYLDASKSIGGRFVRLEEVGLYTARGGRLVREDGYVLPERSDQKWPA